MSTRTNSRPPVPAGKRIDELAAFYESRGRLPITTATDPAEKSLAYYLVMGLRQQERRGKLSPELREKARRIPGALDVRARPDQDAVLEELQAYTAKHGHRPRFGDGASAQERRLQAWVSNNIRGNIETKTPALGDRHRAILGILDAYPSFSDWELEQRVAEAEAFLAANGHQPKSGWLTGYRTTRHRAAPHLAERIAVILAAPDAVNARWEANFAALRVYAAAHCGQLPTGWHQDQIFSWLTVQRRAYRHGKMPAARAARLRTLPGVLSERQELPRAA